ncbi:MAG TPA: MFS transporter [Rhizomicrobium sp.]|nr:MFS transporter [Rhizomicrobium sp.]
MTAEMAIISVVSKSPPSIVAALAPLMSAVLVGFLVTGAALPVLPLHVHDGLGFGPVMVAVVAGCQFAASLVARIWSGRAADTRGPKWAVTAGLVGAAASGLLYLFSLSFLSTPGISIGVLLAGRAVLGGAESFIITGATTWGLALAGAHNAGKVIAWMGTAMFAALAVGAPLGTALYAKRGFGAVSCAVALAPLLSLTVIAPLRPEKPAHKSGPSLLSVATARFGRCLGQRRVWRHRHVQLASLCRA